VDPDLTSTIKSGKTADVSVEDEAVDPEDDLAGSEASFRTAPEDEHGHDAPIPKGKWDDDCAKARAVLNANIAACYVKLVSPCKDTGPVPALTCRRTTTRRP
jgi:hypothetical protein